MATATAGAYRQYGSTGGTTFTVHHIETQNHDVILANEAPSETPTDVAAHRHGYINREHHNLYGHERIIPAQPLPRISSARLVPKQIKNRMAHAQNQATSATR